MPNQFRFIAFAVGCSLHMTLLASAQAATQLGRPLDAEAGCTGMGGQGAVAVIKAGRLSGMPAVANSALPDLAKKHLESTRGEGQWVEGLRGSGGRNRIFVQNKHQVLVLTVCNPKDCALNRAYIAYELTTHQYGAKIVEGGPVRDIVPGAQASTFAVQPTVLEDALSCAFEADLGRD
jgi:hypothetical protein